ncbi:MAG: helix-turn-helix domain-containing protein [Oscillospiraceae bacterium]|nr:helix-turn-helix domain-containing protein [Oscillospiraceae bacterium]
MEIGKQIKKYRTELKLSQDDLADKVYVTRQTISNWENDRNYPDIRSLVLLSNVFGISLDILVKGDLEQMKDEIKTEDIRKFQRDSRIYGILLAGQIALPMPLLYYLKVWGIVIWLLWTGVALWWAWRIEKYKKTHDIHTYKEIVAFMEGKRLDELEKNQEIGKRPYQIAMLVALTAVVGLAVVYSLRRVFFHF